jgi:hypothetical protein
MLGGLSPVNTSYVGTSLSLTLSPDQRTFVVLSQSTVEPHPLGF